MTKGHFGKMSSLAEKCHFFPFTRKDNLSGPLKHVMLYSSEEPKKVFKAEVPGHRNPPRFGAKF